MSTGPGMNTRAGLACLVMALSGLFSSVEAQVSHRVRLAAAPVVHVWENSQPVGKGGSVSLEPARAHPARNASDRVVTGNIIPVRVTANARTSPRAFRVASNAPFSIEVSCPGVDRARAVTFSLMITDIGPGAQMPGPTTSFASLDQERPTSILYKAQRRTARTPGLPIDQSVRFELTSHEDSLDLSTCRFGITASE